MEKKCYIWIVYDRVYIYEFEGDVSSRIPCVKGDNDFIGFWKEGTFSFLFFRTAQDVRRLSAFPPIRSRLVIRYEDWESGRPLDLHPLGSFLIHPPWKAPTAGPLIPICIDPGMAFGSGYHASTKGCLFLLEKFFQQEVPRTVCDVGTGSGILAIASLKKGASIVWAIDENNLAIETAKRNRHLNRLEGQMHLLRANALQYAHVRADLLMANLHVSLLLQMLEQDSFFGKRYYLLSGLLSHEADRIEAKFHPRLRVMDRYEENFWCSYLLRGET